MVRAKVVVRIRNSLVNTPNGGMPQIARTGQREHHGKQVGDAQPPDFGVFTSEFLILTHDLRPASHGLASCPALAC